MIVGRNCDTFQLTAKASDKSIMYHPSLYPMGLELGQLTLLNSEPSERTKPTFVLQNKTSSWHSRKAHYSGYDWDQIRIRIFLIDGINSRKATKQKRERISHPARDGREWSEIHVTSDGDLPRYRGRSPSQILLKWAISLTSINFQGYHPSTKTEQRSCCASSPRWKCYAGGKMFKLRTIKIGYFH